MMAGLAVFCIVMLFLLAFILFCIPIWVICEVVADELCPFCIMLYIIFILCNIIAMALVNF
nr:MAG TPA: VKORC1/thioredoxin domain protein [Caudoviricetes sp.]